MYTNTLDGCPSTSFITLLICIQCSDNNFGESDVSRYILYVPGGRGDIIRDINYIFNTDFKRELSVIPSTIKKLLGVVKM